MPATSLMGSGIGVQGGDGGTPAHGLEGMAPPAGAEVEQPVAGAEAEAFEADGQHGTGARPSGARGAARSSSGSCRRWQPHRPAR